MTVRHVAVVGHGAAAAIAATALARAFGRGGLVVSWIETLDETSPNTVLAGWPNLAALHRLLGVDTGALMRAAGGSFALGRQYVGFAGGDGEYLHSYGPVGRPVEGLPFIQLWLKARAAGLPAGFADFAREAVAARNGRIRALEGAGGRETAHGHHFDARGYGAALRAHAVREGVTITLDADPRPSVADGRVTALHLSGGQTITADLIVDATAGASVLGVLSDGEPPDASVSSCNRLLTGSGRPFAPVPLYSRVAAHRAGWAALQPLQGRTGILVAFDDRLMDAREAASQALLPFVGEPQGIALTPVRRGCPWVGNVVAIGDAAGVAEPLAVPELHRVQIAITHLVALFPVRADAMPEAGIYNEEMAEWNARLQDFEAAPYRLNTRHGEPFWDAARTRPVSPTLEARIDLFSARGMVAQYNQDSLTEDEWQAVFLGLGLSPRAWDPQVDRVDEGLAMTNFREQLAAIRTDVTAMDTHDAALARIMRR